MELVADTMLVAGALGAAFYCYILSARLRRFTDLEKGVGGAVAVLSAQVDDLAKSLAAAQSTASGSVANLSEVSDRAEKAARRLELLVASLHDLPQEKRAPSSQPKETPPQSKNPFFVRNPSMAGAHR